MAEDSLTATRPHEGLPVAPGQLIGERYLVGQVLGGGGMGVVLAGTHVLLGTPVAVKLIHSELKDDPEAVQRFLNEARTTAALKGEHIARVFDVGVLATGEPYIVMEHLQGSGLDQYLKERGPLGQTEAVDIVLECCEGLAEAHAAGLVHRDVKPANLFLARRPDGQFSVKILDFGIAKRPRPHGDEPRLTDPGKSLGSPWYMSPEQMLTAHAVDERADVWSLGVLLFELFTNLRPFEGETLAQVCGSVLTAPAPRLHEFRDDVPSELEDIMLCCLEKDPARRFGSVTQLAEALLPFASLPAQVTLRPTAADSSSNHARPAGWPPMLTLLVLSVLVVGWLQYRDPTLLPRAMSAAAALPAQRLHLPWDPHLLPDSPAPELDRTSDPLPPPKTIHLARAVPEIERESADSTGEDDTESLTPDEARERAETYESWLRAQGLERLPGR
ncbi:MAG TPA: serine/threonine-protein kinase [Polyangiaceae bacterium]|nr:serine/threonine-protein kinase [Polyangiaceae bacterium]